MLINRFITLIQEFVKHVIRPHHSLTKLHKNVNNAMKFLQFIIQLQELVNHVILQNLSGIKHQKVAKFLHVLIQTCISMQNLQNVYVNLVINTIPYTIHVILNALAVTTSTL
jgi:hypothetical protein